ncbi:MAG: hypothetical protein K6C40_15695 [Thermoguttaceae bacterium]|nr:hypothetical protein [Thermoguttaceae bacterium]
MTKREKNRALQLESLENRMLLSAVPVNLPDVQPAGTGAVCWTQTFDLQSHETYEVEFQTENLETLSVFCLNANGVTTSIDFGGQASTSMQSVMRDGVSVKSVDAITYTLSNLSEHEANYTLVAFSGSNFESEFQLPSKTNDVLSSAQNMSITTVGTIKQSVLVGQLTPNLGANDTDCYSFKTTNGNVNIQLHTDTASALTFELYASETAEKPIGYATNIDDFTAVLNSAATAKNSTVYVRVHALEGAEVSTVNYTLTVTDGAGANTSSNVETQVVNCLTSSLFFGQLEGSDRVWAKTSQEVENGQIRAIDSNGNRTAVVSYDSSTFSATVALWNYAGTSWTEVASASFVCTSGSLDVSICGDSILVGNKDANSAYLFTLEDGELVQTDLTVNALPEGAKFGTAVLLSEETLFVSAPKNDSGKVYVFEKDGENWSLSQTLTRGTVTNFGSKMVLDAEQNRLCVVSDGSLFFYKQSGSGSWNLESTLTGDSVTNFGSSAALDGNWLAVACQKNSRWVVQIFKWNAGTQNWVWKQDLESEEIEPSFGRSLSFANGQLAVSSLANTGQALVGTIHLYRCVSSGNTQEWKFIQTYDGSTSANFGKTVLLAADRMDVLDFDGNAVAALTNYSNGDSWNLNVTSAGTKVEFQISKFETETDVLILGPDGSEQTFTKTTGDDAVSISFTPSRTGIYKVRLFSDVTRTYYLRATSNALAAFSSGEAAEPKERSNEVIVEYAQQILVSSLDSATAVFRDSHGAETVLELQGIVNGNQVVWNVPENVPNGAYTLNVSGLKAVSGATLNTLSVPNYDFTGSHTLNLVSVGSEGSNVRRGELEISVGTTFEILDLTEEEAANVNFLVEGLDDYTIERTYDPAIQGLQVRILSGESTERVLVKAVLNASFASDEDLVPGSSVVGTLAASGVAKTQTFDLALASGQSVNLALTVTDPASQEAVKMELFDSEGTLLAVDTLLTGDSASQWITTLKNTSPTAANFTVKLTNQTSGAADYTLEIISAQAPTTATAQIDVAGQYFLETFSSVSLEFSENVDLSTLAPSDFQLLLDGESQAEYYVSACQVQDGTHVVLTFNAPLADGVWTLGLAGNAEESASIQTLSGTDFVLSAAAFSIDSTNPAVENITFLQDSSGKMRIFVKFSEAVQEATPTLIGKIYGRVDLVSGEGSYDELTNIWTLTTRVALPSDFYTFSISNIKDTAGNVTEEATTKGLAITTNAVTVSNVVSDDPSTGWLPQYMDGSQAFVHQIIGCVTQSHSASFVLDGIEDGEQIAFSFMSPAGYGDPCWNDHIKAEWNAATKTVTIRYDASAHSGGLTEAESAQATAGMVDNGSKAGVFVMYILRNANYENADFTDPMDVQLSELAEKTDAQGNVQKIRQTSAMGTISSAGDSDVYRFTVDGKSTIFAGLTINSVALGTNTNFKIQLYEELPNGNRGALLAEANSSSMGEKVSDSLDVWLENVRNHSDEAQTYQLVVSASNVSASGALYTLVLTENAVFNAEKYTTVNTITELYDSNSALGHVSSAIAGFTSAGIYNSLDAASSAVYGDYVFVGDYANNQVLIYAPNASGTALEQVGTVKTGASVSGDGFGAALVLNGTTLAISAPGHSNGDGTTGAVYLFDLGSIDTAGNSSPIQTITNPGNSHDFGLIMDYSENLGLLVVGSQTAFQMSYLFDLGDGEAAPATCNLTQILAGYVNLQLEADGQTPVIQNNQLSWSDEWSNFGYSVAIDDAGLVVVGAPSANTYSAYNSTNGTWTTESGSNGMVFVLAMNGSSMRLAEDSDLGFGYSVTSENGVLVAAAAPGNNVSGIALHTFDFRKASPADDRFVLTDLVISESVGALPQAVQIRNGFLYVTGASASNPDTPLTLCSSSVWPYDTQEDIYHFTADGSSISVAFDAGLRGNVEDLEVVLTDEATGAKIQGTIQNGTFTYSVTAGTEYRLAVGTTESAECDYVMTVQGITQNDYSFGLTEAGVKVNGGAISETLTTYPASVTFTLEKPVRADLISKSSVQIDGVSASGFTLSADGKTATFTFAYKQFTETTATLTIRAEDFCTVDGSILALTDAEATQTLTLAQSTVEQKIRAREDSLEATWTFEENLKNANANVTILKKASGSNSWVNITSTGSLTRQGNVLKWTAGSVLAGTGDLISIYLDSSSVSMVSGCPVEQVDALEQMINLSVQGETSLVVRKTSTLDETGEAAATTRQEIPASEKWIDEWQNVWVEVWASVLSATETGLKSYTAEISYDPVKFNPVKNGNISVKYDSTIFSSVTVTKVANENKLQIQATVKAGLENVGVCDLEGVGDHVLLGSIQFYAQKDGVHLSETYAVEGAAIGIQIVENTVVLEGTNETAVSTVENTTQNLPAVYPVVYDLDDSGTIDINDLVAFARVFAQPAVPFTITGAADFNAGGSVEINDLVLFARNFGKKEGSSIIYADALIRDWGDAPVQGAALPEPMVLPTPEPTPALSESTPAFQTSFGNVYVNDWTAQAPDFQKQIAEENALRAELLEEALPQAAEKETVSSSSDEAFELDSVLDEMKKEETDELDVTLGKMIF